MRPAQGPTLDRDPRYWRRRANRQVRKARLTRTLLRWSALMAVNGFIAGVLLYSGSRILQHLAASPELALRRVEVTGAERSSAGRIRNDLARYIGRNVLSLDLREVEALAGRDPWVRRVTVKRKLPDGLRIAIHERRPVALAVISGVVHVIDDTGYVIGPVGGAADDDLPVLTGLGNPGRAELIATLRRGADVVERLRNADPGFFDRMSELNLSRSDRIEVRTVSRGPALLLNPEQVERNVPQYVALEQEIQRRTGSSLYVDLRWRDRILVMPQDEIQSTRKVRNGEE